jgi:hypothetical protein
LAESQFRTIAGVVQFEPRDGNAGGKEVRNITVRATGVKEQALKVGATLWPSHAHVAVDKGDFVVIEGKFTRNKGTNKDGEEVVYNNMSVTNILVLGTLDAGREVETVNTRDDADFPVADDDDIPF